MKWIHLTIIGAVLGFFIGAGLYIGIPIAAHGIERMADTSKETLNVVNDVSRKVDVLETKQQIIIHRLNKRNEKFNED